MKKPIELGRKYQTRSGCAVQVLCVDGPGARPVVASMFYGDTWTPLSYDAYGQWTADPNPYDFIPVKTKRVGWINSYCHNNMDMWTGTYVFETKAGAVEAGRRWTYYAATVKIEWEE